MVSNCPAKSAIKLLVVMLCLVLCTPYGGSIDTKTAYNAAGTDIDIKAVPEIDAGAYVLVDSASGRVLLSKNADKTGLYPASMTKMMTAIIALENGDLDRTAVASPEAIRDIGKDGMNIGLQAGEKVKMIDLINAMMITSANEAANIVAENVCKSRAEFVRMMNAKAKQLGALNTHFTNPCGSHDKQHCTTARDMCVIACHAMNNPLFREIVSRKSYTMPLTNIQSSAQSSAQSSTQSSKNPTARSSWITLVTTNKLLKQKQGSLFTVNGIKTGYTAPAGYNLAASAISGEGMELISVIMNVPANNGGKSVFDYSEKLLEYGFNNYSLAEIGHDGQDAGYMNVQGLGSDEKVGLVTSGTLKAVMPKDKDLWSVKTSRTLKPAVAPIKKGDNLGYVEYYSEEEYLGKVEVVSADTIYPAFLGLPAYVKPAAETSDVKQTPAMIKALVIIAFIALISLITLSKQLKSSKMPGCPKPPKLPKPPQK